MTGLVGARALLGASQAAPMRWDVINAALARSDGRRYLEIGVQHGHCAQRVRAREKWGVDPAPMHGAASKFARFFVLPSDVFFAELDEGERFDVIFIDGLHHADQTMRDTENALRHLAPGGTIILHDCNPQTELAQRVPRATGVWNGDCWKTLVRLRQRPDLTAYTIDADEGLGIVRPEPNPAPLTDVPELTWPALRRDRERLLGLTPAFSTTQPATAPVADRLGVVAVVTAIFGGRDEPLPAPKGSDADKFVMFTDGPGAPGWSVETFPVPDNPRLEARRVKTLALDLVDADTVVWVDGRIRVTGAPLRSVLRRAISGTDIAGFPHPWRRCAYDEAEECARLGLASELAVADQVAAYRAARFPANLGLWNTMVLARKRTPRMVEFGRQWWDEIRTRTVRDQISLPYLLHKHGIRCGQLGRDVYHDGASPNFQRGRHA